MQADIPTYAWQAIVLASEPPYCGSFNSERSFPDTLFISIINTNKVPSLSNLRLDKKLNET